MLDGPNYDLPPGPNEIELSLFGPGYGESAALHLGSQQWLIVDSCVDAQEGGSPALAYLERIGVSAARDVVQVVATHWHDDHVRGLSSIVSECAGARFACSAAIGSNEFVTLAEVYEHPLAVDQSGVSEFLAVLNLLADRGVTPVLAKGDLPLWRSANGAAIPSEIVAVSPSEDAVRRALLEIANLIPADGERRKIPDLDDNLGSVAIWVRVGTRTVLLGADLERRNNAALGWEAVLGSITRPLERCQAYKVAHHGSQNGHHDGVWSDLLEPDAWAVLAPWTLGGRQVPNEKEVRALCRLTQRAFSTSSIRAPGTIAQEHRVERVLKQAVRYIRSLEGPLGHIRLRASAEDPNPDPAVWAIELFGAAEAICA